MSLAAVVVISALGESLVLRVGPNTGCLDWSVCDVTCGAQSCKPRPLPHPGSCSNLLHWFFKGVFFYGYIITDPD